MVGGFSLKVANFCNKIGSNAATILRMRKYSGWKRLIRSFLVNTNRVESIQHHSPKFTLILWSTGDWWRLRSTKSHTQKLVLSKIDLASCFPKRLQKMTKFAKGCKRLLENVVHPGFPSLLQTFAVFCKNHVLLQSFCLIYVSVLIIFQYPLVKKIMPFLRPRTMHWGWCDN